MKGDQEVPQSDSGGEELLVAIDDSRAFISGFFYHTIDGKPAYAPFCLETVALPDPSLSFLPEDVSVKASSRGLLCCHGRRTNHYYVCNPLNRVWAALPPQRNVHSPGTAVVLVLHQSQAQPRGTPRDFWVVCKYSDVAGLAGEFSVEKFSSATWRWEEESWAEEPLGRVECGLAANGEAWWRMTKQTIVAYNPQTNLVRTISGIDDGLMDKGRSAWWEMGEVGGLPCITNVVAAAPPQEPFLKAEVLCMFLDEQDVQIYEGGWCGFMEGVSEQNVRPLRMQGAKEMVFWDGDRRIFGCDLWNRQTRVLVINTPDYCTDFLPYCFSALPFRKECRRPADDDDEDDDDDDDDDDLDDWLQYLSLEDYETN
ncbi:F-box/kelch-repeat protein [Canna indica]|uniref:F-box/kelch-repeat protein n=1 Tax=Canna indica TaxID=4628 RepID=A0AAQ3Q6L8_9LILI|nr:F-box/kelch-repeat protein [Canna indica]